MKFYNQWFLNLKLKINPILIKNKCLRRKTNCKLTGDKLEAIFRTVKKKKISLKIKIQKMIFKKEKKAMSKKSNCRIYN